MNKTSDLHNKLQEHNTPRPSVRPSVRSLHTTAAQFNESVCVIFVEGFF